MGLEKFTETCIREYLSDPTSDLYITDDWGTPLFFRCISGGYRDLISIMIDRGFDIDHKDDNGYTALHWISFCHKYDIAILLLSKGASLHLQDLLFRTPLQFAWVQKDRHLIDILLEESARRLIDERHKELSEDVKKTIIELYFIGYDSGRRDLQSILLNDSSFTTPSIQSLKQLSES